MGLVSFAVEQFGKKAIESGVEHVAEHAIASRVAGAAASEAGQAAISRYAGGRVASMAASKPGQFVVKRMTRNAIKPDHSGDQRTTPTVAPATTPNVNLQQTIQTSVQRALRSGTSGGGRGSGWWNLMQQPGDDWRQIGDLSVGRGPAHWDLPRPGKRTAAFVGGLTARRQQAGVEAESYNGQRVSDTDISQINANLRTYGQPLPQPPVTSGTGPRAQAFDLGMDYSRRSSMEAHPFSTWPKPPTVEQEPGQITPYKRTGPWVTSGGSFT